MMTAIDPLDHDGVRVETTATFLATKRLDPTATVTGRRAATVNADGGDNRLDDDDVDDDKSDRGRKIEGEDVYIYMYQRERELCGFWVLLMCVW